MFSTEIIFSKSKIVAHRLLRLRLRDLLGDYRIHLLLISLIFLLHGSYFGTYIFDDSAISLTYARNLAEGHGLVLNPGGERVEGYSNFLWVVLLSTFFRAGLGILGPVVILKFSGFIFGLATLVLLFFISRVAYDADTDDPVWLFGPFALSISTPFVLWTVSGLENPLYSFLILLSAYLYLREIRDPSCRPWSAFALVLVAITRPEGIIYFVTIFFHRLLCIVFQKRFSLYRDLIWTLIFVVSYGIFFVWRYNYFGYWVPNTFYAKASEREVLMLWNYIVDFNDDGWLYVLGYLKGQLMPIFLVFAVITVLTWKYWVSNSLFIGLLASTLLYIIYVGGDWWWEFRFISPIIPVITLLIGQGLFRLKHLLKEDRFAFPLLFAITIFAMLVPNVQASSIWHSTSDEDMVGMWSIAERGLRFKEYAETAHIKGAKYLEPDIGGTAFFSGLEVIDLAMLADVHLARFKYYPLFFKQYLFGEQRPDFVHTHGGWTKWSGITTYPEFWESYIPINYYEDEYGISGDFVRKDLFVTKDVDQIREPFDIEFSQLSLVEFLPDTPVAFPGQSLTFNWSWQCKETCEKDYSLLLEIRGKSQQTSLVTEYMPVFGWYPTSQWAAGEIIKTVRDIKIPSDFANGSYQLFIGVTDGETTEYQPFGEFVINAEYAQRLASQNYAEFSDLTGKSQFEAALQKIELVARLDPSNQQYLQAVHVAQERLQDQIIKKASLSLGHGYHEAAASLLLQAVTIKPLPRNGQDVQNKLSQIFFAQGQHASAQHRYERAFDYFKRSLEVKPSNAWARHRLEDTRVNLHYIDYLYDTQQYNLLYQTFVREREVGNVPQDKELLEKLYAGIQSIADQATLEYLQSQISAPIVQEQPFVTQEIRYRLPEAGEVFLFWGVDGWNLMPDEIRPSGTVVKDSVMYTPMDRESDIFVARIQVPINTTIDYGFLITKKRNGVEIDDIWDKSEDYNLLAIQNDIIEVEPLLTLPQVQRSTNIRVPSLITQEIHYHMPEAGEVLLAWGIDGWNVVSEEIRPAGTILKDGIMYTPMAHKDDRFIAVVQVPPDALINYGFLITRRYTGVNLEGVWEGDKDTYIVAEQDGIVEFQTELSLLQAEDRMPPKSHDPSLVTHEIRYRLDGAGEVFLVWGIDGWKVMPEEIRPIGTLVKESVMYTPMVRDDNTFVARVYVPPGKEINYAFYITKTNLGTPIEIWDTNGEPGRDYRTESKDWGVDTIKSSVTLPKDTLDTPFVTHEIRYHSPEAGEITLLGWSGIWVEAANEIQPNGVEILDGIIRAPMERIGDTFVVSLRAPAESGINFGFQISKKRSGAPIDVWDGGHSDKQNYYIIAQEGGVTEIAAAVNLADAREGTSVRNVGLLSLLAIAIVLGVALVIRYFPRQHNCRTIVLMLVGLMILGLFLRLWIAWETNQALPDTHERLSGDESGYDFFATELLEGSFFQYPFRTPIYPIFLAAVYALFGYSYAVVLYVQAFVSVTAVPLTFILARRFTSVRTSLMAAALIAIHPGLILHVPRLLTEAIYTPLLLLTVLSLLWALERPQLLRFALSGATLAVLTLCRPATALMVGILPFIMPLKWTLRHRIATSCVYGAAMVAVIAPWTYHNYQTYNTFLPLSVSGIVLWHGTPEFYHQMEQKRNLVEITSKAYDATRNGGADPFTIDGNRYFLARSIASIKAEPDIYIRYFVEKLAYFWIGHPAKDWPGYGIFKLESLLLLYPAWQVVGIFITRLIPLVTVVCMILLHHRLGRFWPLLAILAYFTFVHAISYADVRYSEPLHPILITMVVAAVSERLRRYHTRRQQVDMEIQPVSVVKMSDSVTCTSVATNPASIWIVVPAFNEGGVINQVLDKLTKLPYNIVVVDDGSSDNTFQQASRFPVKVLQHACNLGQGAALQTGISYALRSKETQYIVTFDSDGQHQVEDIERLLEPLQRGTHEVVLGSRFLRDEDVINMKTRRRLLLRLAVAFTRITTGLRVSDAHNGLRAFSAEAASKIVITQNRMAHASEILSQIAVLKLRYCEVPVTITYTSYSVAKGQTVLNSLNIVWDLVAEKIR